MEQLSVLHNKPVQKVMNDFCNLLPTGARDTCKYYVKMYGVEITKLLEMGLNAGMKMIVLRFVDFYYDRFFFYAENNFSFWRLIIDEVCHGITLCTKKTCGMYLNNDGGDANVRQSRLAKRAASAVGPQFRATLIDVQQQAQSKKQRAARAGEDPWQWFKHVIEAVGRHEPEVDLDGDHFSSLSVLRGYNWRGMRKIGYVITIELIRRYV
jgi:hypothetical protein